MFDTSPRLTASKRAVVIAGDKKDMADLDTVAELADLVGLSFVQRVEDIGLLEAALAARRGREPLQALVLKIETPLAVRTCRA